MSAYTMTHRVYRWVGLGVDQAGTDLLICEGETPAGEGVKAAVERGTCKLGHPVKVAEVRPA